MGHTTTNSGYIDGQRLRHCQSPLKISYRSGPKKPLKSAVSGEQNRLMPLIRKKRKNKSG